jgi:hypothetical protein
VRIEPPTAANTQEFMARQGWTEKRYMMVF